MLIKNCFTADTREFSTLRFMAAPFSFKSGNIETVQFVV